MQEGSLISQITVGGGGPALLSHAGRTLPDLEWGRVTGSRAELYCHRTGLKALPFLSSEDTPDFISHSPKLQAQ